MNFQKLPRKFYLQPTLQVAKQLLNKLLVRKFDNNFLIGKIVETEAYLPDDSASHSFKGKTERNSAMFEEGGHLYVYFTYGMHYCCNIVTERKGRGCAVLLRGVEPISGIDVMKKNRVRKNLEIDIRELTNGPAKICQSFSISKQENGADLLGNEIFIAENLHNKSNVIRNKYAVSPRIGLRSGFGDTKKWRFFLTDNIFVSKQITRSKNN
ncbi:MAG: DNA-3-methyladenine glycosylase [Bacteroidota bacterium]